MDAARRVLVFEGGMGLLWAAYGLGTAPSTAVRWWWVVGLAAAVAAVGGYVGDRDLVGFDSVDQGRLLVGAVLGVVAGGAVVVHTTALSVEPGVTVGIGGLGAGLVAYRTVYGVVLPVPEARLDAARKRTV